MFVDFGQFGKQMIQTPLLGQGLYFIISTPEITNQDSLEQGTQKLFQDRRSPTLGNEVIARLLVGKTP